MGSRISVLELRSVRGTGGGPEKTILLGAEHRDRDRFDVTVCYIRDTRDTVFGIDKRARHLRIDYVEARERHSFDPRIWRRLTTLVRDRRIEIVHSHDYKTDLLALLLSWRTNVISVATAHGWTGHTARETYLYYPFGKKLLARFPRVIAVSTDIKDELVRHGVRTEKIVTLLNGIDPVAFRRNPHHRERIRRNLGYKGNHLVIGAVGRLERQKRFDLLIEAAASLMPEHPDLRLAIAGDGSLRRDLAELASRFDISTRVAFLGHQEDIADLHHAFDLFVQSSEYEGTPNAVLEAMALETPVVATDVGGTRELATPDVHAVIVPKHDVPGLRGAIQGVLADPAAARRRAVAARTRVEQELSFEARTRRLEAIYDELVGVQRGVKKRDRDLAHA